MDRVEHYGLSGAVYFYGGWASSFAKGYGFVAYPYGSKPDDERVYPTREHWFHANKTLNDSFHEDIRKIGGPRDAKSLGRQVTLRAGWDEGLSYRVMLIGIQRQIAQHAGLLALLLQTGRRAMAEDSPTDGRWGIRGKDGGFTGMNLLGLAWMEARNAYMGDPHPRSSALGACVAVWPKYPIGVVARIVMED